MSRALGAGADLPVRPPGRLGTVALVGVTGLATVALAMRAGNPAVAAAPALLGALLWVMWTVPVRWSATVLVTLILSLDLSDDAMGKWHSRAAVFGDLLRDNLDKVLPGSGLKLSGSEVLVLLLIAVAIWRRAVGDDKDTRGQEQTAGVLRGVSLLFLAGVAYATVVGLAGGGSVKFAIVQVRPMLRIAAFYLLFHLAYRGAQDHLTLARVTLLAACIKSGLAWWVDRFVAPTAMMRKWEFSTNHGDSILFVVAALVVVTHLLERPDRARLVRAAVFLPIIALGMLHNHRRLAYVGLAMALLCIYALAPWRGWKRWVTRAGLVAAPLLALYLAVGWTSPESRIFAPIRVLRTVSDARIDRSTLYRDVENWNLTRSIAEAPVVGRGFGHGFSEYIKGDDISTVFELYLIEPHNAILGLLLFGGLFGFTAMWALMAVGIFLAARAYRFSALPEDRVAALCAMSAIVVCVVQTYGDMGQYAQQYQIYVALALVVAGKLAVRTGAWPRGPSPLAAAAPTAGWRARTAAHLAASRQLGEERG
jgi:hypothetical protein